MSTLTPERLRSLAKAAVAAPSADNQSMFRLLADGDTLNLIATPELLNAPAGRQVLSLISLGAVAENLLLRAGKLGLKLDESWADSLHSTPWVAQFQCHECDRVDDPLDAAIERRHSNRRMLFRGPALPNESRDRLGACASGLGGAQLVWLDEKPLRREALRLIRWAETERFRDQALHRELFESIRFDIGWKGTASEGIAPGSLELPWIERPLFELIRNWKVQRLANLVGAHRFIGLRAADLPCRFAPHLCVITAAGDVSTGALRAGRLLQRIWLRTTAMQLSLQVFAASALYALEEYSPARASLRNRLGTGWSQLIPRDHRPYLVIRMGYAPPPSIRSGRPAPAELLCQK